MRRKENNLEEKEEKKIQKCVIQQNPSSSCFCYSKKQIFSLFRKKIHFSDSLVEMTNSIFWSNFSFFFDKIRET